VTTSSEPDRRSWDWSALGTLAAVCGPALFLLVAAWSHRWTTDDSFIDFHVVDNLRTGYGPVFNISDRVEVYTSPLCIALLAISESIAGIFVPGRPPLEWCSVILGMLSAALALIAGSIGARQLWRTAETPPPVMVPLGSLAIIALVPFWDFATSGLESSLVFLWLGSSFWGLTRLCNPYSRRKTLLLAVWIGFGPLVRPDLGLFSLIFLGLLVVLIPGRQRGIALAAALALPLTYQVFRMGYFGALVPNTAIAKESFLPNWSRGWSYLKDFMGPYRLWFPLTVLTALELGLILKRLRRGAYRETMILAAPIAGGLTYALFIMRFGGDFLHARLLLPSLFALVLPVSVVPLRLFKWCGPLLVPWALTCGLWFRPDYQGATERKGIERGRENYLDAAVGMAHPVRLQDHAALGWPEDGEWLLSRADAWALQSIHSRKTAAFSVGPGESHGYVLFEPWVKADAVAYRVAVGMVSYGGGQRVHICDAYGISDPLGARLRLDHRDKSGHEKLLARSWCAGRMIRADHPLPAPLDRSREEIAAARAAWRCGIWLRYMPP